MKPQEIFDICHERYRRMRERPAEKLRAVNLDQPSTSYQWRPDKTRAAEYLVDFEKAGSRVLARPQWSGRLRLFQIYFLRGVSYRRAISLVGVAEGTFDWWTQEVKKAVGRELERSGLFPPAQYFKPGNS
jgi:hypothetical protein